MTPTTTDPRSHIPPNSLGCMDVWGGNDPADVSLRVTGNDAHLLSRTAGDKGGGDVYYLSTCAAGMVTRFLIADVAGHGEEAVASAKTLRRLMRRHINTADQTRLATDLSREFLEGSDAGRFATAIIGTYFAPTRHLILCNAGHPQPLLFRSSREEWALLTHDTPGVVTSPAEGGELGIRNLPLGVIEPAGYEQFALKLEPGDRVLLYTDGVIESKDERGQMLTAAGLVSLARSADRVTPASLVRGIAAQLASLSNGHPAEDDMTLLALQHDGAQPPNMSMGDRVKVIAKMIGLA